MLASGFAGLGYQLVWTQQCATWLGHEITAVLAVVAAFFGGLALGAWWLGPRIERSGAPQRWYAGCELAIGIWSLVIAVAIDAYGGALVRAIGPEPGMLRHWSVAFAGTFLLLLPATAAMGATLAAMERLCRIVAPHDDREGRAVASLYAANTMGAVLGVLAVAFVLAPALGYSHTALICAAVNLACAVATLRLFGMSPAAPASEVPRSSDARAASLWPLGLSGLLGIGYEVLVVRVLAQVSEGTVYTMASLLAVYLLAAAAGAAVYARLSRHVRWRSRVGEWLPTVTALACLAGATSLWFAGGLKLALLALLPAGLGSALLAEALLATAAFAAPSVCMGALFAHLASQAVAQGVGLGRALAANTFGAALAPPVFGVWLFPMMGPKFALLLVSLGYLVLSVRAGQWPRPLVIWSVPGVGALVLAVAAPRLGFVEVPPGGRILRYDDGVMATVSVVEDAIGVSRLRIDNRQQEGSSATRRVDSRQGLLPVLLHPAPREVLFLGLGTGVTARAAAATLPDARVVAVELVPEVIAASALFAPTQLAGGGVPRVLGADARRYVRTSSRRYDVIVSDNFHPARSGSAALYTVDHFAAVHARLAGGGLFCQWLPLHQMDLDTLRLIVASFLQVFPGGSAVLASNSLETPVIGLVGRAKSEIARDSVSAAHVRVTGGRWAATLADIGIEDGYALLGSFVAGPAALARFTSGTALNTDDHPRVAWRAPRITYAPQGDRPRDRLIALLDAGWQMDPQMLFAPDEPPESTRRVTAYWRARDLFLRAGRDVQVSPDPGRMLAQVEAPLLEALRTSADFRPAYDPLLQLAVALVRHDPVGARDLLTQLAQLQPARREALVVLQDMERGIP